MWKRPSCCVGLECTPHDSWGGRKENKSWILYKEGRRWCDFSVTPPFFHYSHWVVNGSLYKVTLHWTYSSMESNSPVQFCMPTQLPWADREAVWVLYLLLFQATFFTYYYFTYYSFMALNNRVKPCEWQLLSRTPTVSVFGIFIPCFSCYWDLPKPNTSEQRLSSLPLLPATHLLPCLNPLEVVRKYYCGYNHKINNIAPVLQKIMFPN